MQLEPERLGLFKKQNVLTVARLRVLPVRRWNSLNDASADEHAPTAQPRYFVKSALRHEFSAVGEDRRVRWVPRHNQTGHYVDVVREQADHCHGLRGLVA